MVDIITFLLFLIIVVVCFTIRMGMKGKFDHDERKDLLDE